MQRVIVIGADGFLGSHLTLRLAELGKDVLALVFQGSKYDALINQENITLQEFTFDELDKLMPQGYDTLFHMAWAGVSTSYKNEASIQTQNVLYGIKVMEFAASYGIKKVVIPGSAAEVSCGQGIITGLEMPAPSDLYSASKVATRYLCQTYAHQHHIDLVWTLITSIYGPGRNDNNLITYAIKTLLKGEKPSFTGLEQQWDYLYIDDLLDALVALGERGKSGKVYPIGSGEHQQMSEYVYTLRDKIDPSLPLGIGDYPYKNPDKIDNQVLDITALKEDTGFKPRYSFERGIEKTITYFKQKEYGI
jgi:nucleoside-diphosphate-sugar epimerase